MLLAMLSLVTTTVLAAFPAWQSRADGTAAHGPQQPQPRTQAAPGPFSSALEPDAVLRVMTAAADWQLAHPSSHPADDWTQAAFYIGVVGLAGVCDDPKYLAAMQAIGEANHWRPGLRPGHADDWSVVATYANLSRIRKDPRMLAPSRALFDFLASRPYDEPLVWTNGIESRELAWCDSLFMGPPALAALSAATGDRKYLDLATRLWWKTTNYLYDKQEHLYYRDSRYFELKEPNGRKVFWSRGNGWVMAGLARLLGDMPVDYPERPRLVELFKEIANRIASLQGTDGYWRASLLCPEKVPNAETSGTAFFTYGFAWGINNRVLDRERYEPAVRRAWTALIRAMHPDGMLGWVQRIGDEPNATSRETTEVYGVGGLLLAGSEVYRLAGGK